MATLYASNSGYVRRYETTTWSNVRGAATGQVKSDTASYYSSAIRAYHTAGRGSDTYYVGRSYFYFDTSSIDISSPALTGITLNLYGYGSSDSADVVAVKSTAFGGDGGTALSLADFNNFDTSTPYSSEYSSWNKSGYNSIPLGFTASDDIRNNDYLIICLMEKDHDFDNSAPSSADYSAGVYYDPYTGTSRDPYLEYTAAAGYGDNVNGVAAANIGKVKGVATASIGKVIGVD